MNNVGYKDSHRFLAAILAVVMVLSLVPMTGVVNAATVEYSGSFTVTVTDGQNPIAGATVELSAKDTSWVLNKSGKTDSNGVAAFSAEEIETALNEASIPEGDILIGVSMEGYDIASEYATVVIGDASRNVDIVLKAKESTTIDDVKITAPNLEYNGEPQELVSVTDLEGNPVGDDTTVEYYVGDSTEATAIVPTEINAGDYKIKVIVKRDGKEPLEKTVTVTIAPAEIGDIDIVPIEGLKFNGSEQKLVELKGSFVEGDEVIWYVNGEEGIKTWEVPCNGAVGTHSVKVSVTRNNNYKTFEKEVEVEIALGDLDLGGITIETNDRTYDGTTQDALIVNGKGDYDLEYRVGDDGEWQKNVIPMIAEAGTYRIYVKATKEGYNEHIFNNNPENAEIIPFAVTISKATQTIVFSEDVYRDEQEYVTINGSVPYIDKKFDLIAVDVYNLAGGSITYSLNADDAEMAEIDEEGRLTVKYPGVVKVTATLSGNKNYEESSTYCTLYVFGSVDEGATEQFVDFGNDTVDYILGTSIPWQEVTRTDEKITGDIIYEIDDAFGVEINDQTGEINVCDYEVLASKIREGDGSAHILVTARKLADDKYGEDTASYTIVATFAETPENAYTLPEVNGTNGWYISDVVVTPADGYTISQSIVPDSFESTTIFNDQGENNRYIYLKNETGGITEMIAVVDASNENLKIDTVSPDTEHMTIGFSDPVWSEQVASVLTLGFYKPNVKVQFTAKDDTAGIDHFNWTYTKTEGASGVNIGDVENQPLEVTVEDDIAKAELTLTASEMAQYNGKISFTATDKAGNTSEHKGSDYVFILDTISPTVSIKYQGDEAYKKAITSIGNVHYFDSDIEVEITVKEANFFEDQVIVKVSKDGVESPVTLDWTSGNSDEHIGAFTLSGDGNYIVSVSCSDRSGNSNDYLSETITIDKVNPDVKVEFVREGWKQIAKFTVIEHNFRESDVKVASDSTFKDIWGRPISMTAEELTKILQSAKWNQDETNKDKYTFEYEELPAGRYNIKLEYTDIVGRNSDGTMSDFVVDHDAPTDVTIEYSKSVEDVLLETLTLGYYHSDVEVKFTAYDTSAGVKSFTWSYSKADGASESQTSDIAASDRTTVGAVQDETDKSKYTATVKLTAEDYSQMKGTLSVYAIDYSGNQSATYEEAKSEKPYNIVIDTVSPTMEVSYTEYDNYIDDRKNYYYNNDVEVKLTITESNFYSDDVVVKVSKDGAEATVVVPEWGDVSVDKHIGTFTLSGDGDYIVTIEYTDKSGNPMSPYISDIHTIDTVSPMDIKCEFDLKTQTTTFSVTEHNFYPKGITVNGTIKDITNKDSSFSPESLTKVLREAEWIKDDDTYTFVYDYCPDGVYANGIYDLEITVVDLATKDASAEPNTFIIDHVAPTAVKIEYSKSIVDTVLETLTLGFYNPDATITFIAYDYASGVKNFAYKYTKELSASNVNRESDDSYTVIEAVQDSIDSSKFTASITLPQNEAEQLRGYFSVIATDEYGNASGEFADKEKVIVVDTISPKVNISYTKAFQSIGTQHYYNGNIEVTVAVTEANFFEKDVSVLVQKDGGNFDEVKPKWDSSDKADEYLGTFTLKEDGDYIIKVSYKDRSQNTMEEYNGEAPIGDIWESETLTIDTTAPILDFFFDLESQKTTFTVTEHNFRASDITVSGDIGDITGAAIQHTGETLTNILRAAEWAQNGDVYTYTYDYAIDKDSYANGIYDLVISYKDISGNPAQNHEPETFIIDHVAPTDVRIEYSKSIVDTVLETLTLGFYNPDVTITFTAHDYASGVKTFEFKYTKQVGASNINRDTDTEATPLSAKQDNGDKSKFTASVTLPESEAEQLRGLFSVVAIDTYGNSSAEELKDDYVVIVDTEKPTISVEYSEPSRIYGDTSYYKGDIEVTFTITEANFFAEDVQITVSGDGGSAGSITPVWSDADADVHIGQYTLTGDGDYTVSVRYTDRSGNLMDEYTSERMTIDTTAPVISVEYQNKDVKNTFADLQNNDRKYYSDTQTVVVKITERNFLPEEVETIINATDVAGGVLDVKSLYNEGSGWTSSGEEHTITLTFPGDANYSFDIGYVDLATNEAEDYKTDYFTVDKTAPQDITVEYSSGIFETILESVTFGFYNAKAKVTISAEDPISGVHKFVYSYLNAEGVSAVNAQLIDQAIEAADVSYTDGGATATISFEIPKTVLNDTQFNGTVSFAVSDRSGNTAEKDEEKRIVVDNIAPTAQVTYNNATNVEGNISYYNGNINVAITINEANFYSDDVQVIVTKDSGTPTAVSPKWTDSSVDVHVGTFTLTEDGDYVITINYKDKSTNQMNEYTSKQLTIDTAIEAPTYYINGSKKEDLGGAYKNDVTVEFNFADQNFDAKKINLTRISFNKTEDVTEQFVTVTNKANGGAGIFSIPEVVENDGVYVLTVGMSDKAKHNVESQVKFTVNRFGSVYEYGDDLANLIVNGGKYVTSVSTPIVIAEYNADRIIEDSLNVLITRDGQVIDTKYSMTNDDLGENGWYKYIYTIDPSNFAEDGVYKITITSKYKTDDEESNDSASVPDNSMDENGNKILDTMTFTVDKTAPEIRNIVNLSEPIVNAQSLDVKFTIVDVGGLKAVEIVLNGETLETITEFGDGQFNYSGQFSIGESTAAQTVQLKVTDLAGNITDTASESFSTGDLYVFSDTVTVSTNFFVRWYANKPLFWGSIGSVVAVATAVCVAVAFRRKKKESEK